MQDRVHKDFILSQSLHNIEEVVISSKCIGNGIETYPLHEHVMQSLFLRMTGEQEQKFKCLCWEIATTDYDFRYKIYTKDKLGECSDYEEKAKIYKTIVSLLYSYDSSFDLNSIDKNLILSNLKTSYFTLLDETNIVNWDTNKYREAKDVIGKISIGHFLKEKELLSACRGLNLVELYKNHLYRQRNRLAHNLVSYQNNLPSLKTLAKENNIFNNYFLYFFVLLLIDAVLRELYKEYLRLTENFIV